MAENKTKLTKLSVSAFIAGLEDPARRADAKALAKMMESGDDGRETEDVGPGDYRLWQLPL